MRLRKFRQYFRAMSKVATGHVARPNARWDCMTKGCCTPSRLAATPQDLRAQCDAKADFDVTEDSVDIPGGTAFVGTRAPKIADDGEGPLRKVKIAPFRLGRTCVTNADFARFVEATGYQTEAEIFGWSFVFWSDLKADVRSEGIPGSSGGAKSTGPIGETQRQRVAVFSSSSSGLPRRPYLLERRCGLRKMGWWTSTNGSRMGARRAGRAWRCLIPLGF